MYTQLFSSNQNNNPQSQTSASESTKDTLTPCRVIDLHSKNQFVAQ